MRTTLATLFTTLALASCGGGSSMTDGGATDSGPAPDASYCVSDGTPVGDCHHFDCLVRAAGATDCAGGGFRPSFGCDFTGLSPAYQTQLQSYFNSCGPLLAGIVDDTMVPLMGGGHATAAACEIVNCATMPTASRPMSVGCYPLTDPMLMPAALNTACDLPSPM